MGGFDNFKYDGSKSEKGAQNTLGYGAFKVAGRASTEVLSPETGVIGEGSRQTIRGETVGSGAFQATACPLRTLRLT